MATLQHDLNLRGYPDANELFSMRSTGSSTRMHTQDNSHSVLIVFIGGCTLSEINALRLFTLSRSNTRWQLYFAPTSVWTHEKIFKEIENSQ